MKDGVILRVNKPARMGIDDASLYPLQSCLPRGLRSALLRKASVLRNWLLRKWDARQPSSAFSRSQHFRHVACRAACVRRCYEKQACYEIGCYENGTRACAASLLCFMDVRRDKLLASHP